MSRKLPHTPRSRVRASLRQLWLRSRERAAAVKLASNTCACCGRKGSVAKGREVKIQVHHINGIAWEKLIDLVFERLLQTPQDYKVLCSECHELEHNGEIAK